MTYWCRQGYLANWEAYEAGSDREAAELHAEVIHDRNPQKFYVVMVCRDEIREDGPTPTRVFEVDVVGRPVFVATEVKE